MAANASAVGQTRAEEQQQAEPPAELEPPLTPLTLVRGNFTSVILKLFKNIAVIF